MIYAYEPLCYYFGLKPNEFWNNTIKENIMYVQSKIAKKLDRLREQVQLFEVITNKLIKADAMSTKHPEIINIQDYYKSIFGDNKKKDDSAKDIERFFDSLMKAEEDE